MRITNEKTIPILLCFALLTLALPYIALLGNGAGQPAPGAASSLATSSPANSTDFSADAEDPLLILNSATGEVESVQMRDFLIGAVSSELPISDQQETFKAQAIAAHSYALASKAAQLAAPDAALKGAYLKANPAAHEGYCTKAVLQAMWGDQFDNNYAYVCAAVDEVLNQVLLYDGAPALTTYYALSNGSTEASEAVWSTALPYLVRLDAPLDKTAPDYEVAVELSAQEVADALGMNFMALDLSGPPQKWFGAPERSASGYILTIPCGGQSLKGLDVRMALGLRSADFDVVCDENNHFTFTTRGYGHGVGMSQYTANALAVTGKSYADILAYFYPGTVLGTL